MWFRKIDSALVFQGVMNDILQLLLQAIFTLQEEEDDEVEADNTVEEGELDYKYFFLVCLYQQDFP